MIFLLSKLYQLVKVTSQQLGWVATQAKQQGKIHQRKIESKSFHYLQLVLIELCWLTLVKDLFEFDAILPAIENDKIWWLGWVRSAHLVKQPWQRPGCPLGARTAQLWMTMTKTKTKTKKTKTNLCERKRGRLWMLFYCWLSPETFLKHFPVSVNF